MSVPPLPLIKGALWIDNSRFIEPLTICTSKLEKGFLLGRQSIRGNAALNYGTAIHHAMLGQKLKEAAARAGLDCTLIYEDKYDENSEAVHHFLLEHLLVP